MKKILILPFLQMPSGHHQVADTISAYLKEIDDSFVIKKVDIFSYTSCFAEKVTTNMYLNAIKMAPSFYSWLYRHNACRPHETEKRYLFYERFFLKSMKNLINHEKPDIIICTHCLPSYLLNLLKKKGNLSVPVINIYTDFFINTVWGISYIDFHLVTSDKMRQFLKQRNVPPAKIAVTGIPVHAQITGRIRENERRMPPFRVLISGGNLGVGLPEKMFIETSFSGKIHYFILCGTNQNLLKKLEQLQTPVIKPIPYITSRVEMNQLYEQMDLVLTKPGGITVSECLRKRIPLCLLHALPGQEEQNQQYLLEEKLAIKINLQEMEKKLLLFLENEKARQAFQKRISSYTNQLENVTSVLKNFLDR